jgi:tetratricopeptide (TPR) repeat protein
MLARCYAAVASFRVALGQADADAELRQAIEILEALVAEHPDRLEFRRELAQDLIILAEIAGGTSDAEGTLDRAQQTLQTLPDGPETREAHSAILAKRALIDAKQERYDAARKGFRMVLELISQLPGEQATRPDVQARLARATYSLGLFSVRDGAYADARTQYEKAEVLQRRLVATYGENGLFRDEYVRTLVNLALVTWEQARRNGGDLREAESRLRLAVSEASRLQSEVSSAAVRLDFSRASYHLASLLFSQGEHREAEQHLSSAIEQLRLIRNGDSRQGDDAGLLLLALVARIRLCLELKEHALAFSAIQEAEPLAEKTPVEFLHAAAFAAKCAELANDDAALAKPRREAAIEKYAAHAVTLLGRAVEYGFKDSQTLETAPEFRALQGRPDFRNLLARLPKSP